MNFKFTKTKIVISIIIAIVMNLSSSYYLLRSGQKLAPEGSDIGTNLGMFVFGVEGLIIFLISFVIAYIIWSLFQKK